METKQNLVFIMADHQRFDTIYMTQCGRQVTPNLNKLADDGTFFERAYTTCPLCVPARTALATGVYPTKTKVVYNDWSNSTSCKAKTIHDILKNNGYRVGHVGVDHIKVDPCLRQRDYDCFVSHEEYEAWAREKGMKLKNAEDITWIKEKCGAEITTQGYSGVRISDWEYSLDEFKDCYFLNKALDFLNCDDGRPFALFLYLWAPHPPLKIPKEYAALYNADDIVLPKNVGKCAENKPYSRALGAAAQLAQDVAMQQWKNVWAAHLSLVSLMDDIVGKVLTKLNDIGKSDSTAVMFTSDHGDSLGQHSMYQKMEMYEECIHIPLILKMPRGVPKKEKRLVSHLDIAPTICGIIGDNSCNFEGVSLAGEQIPEREAVYSQYSGTYDYGFIRRAVITQKDKYVFDDYGEKEYFVFEKSPDEMNNFANDISCKQRVDYLHKLCKDYHLKHDDYFNWEFFENGLVRCGIK